MEDITIGISTGAGGGVVGVLLTLAFLTIKAKVNGKGAEKTPAPPTMPPELAPKLDALAADHTRHGIILGKLADSRVEISILLKQQVKATEDQTALLRDRLPK